MKNKSEFLGLIANIIGVILLLCFIVLGLNRIGIYRLPAPIEKLIGTYDDKDLEIENDNQVYESMDFDGNDVLFSEAVIDYTNAMELIGEIAPCDNYTQFVTVKHFFDNSELVQNMNIVRNDGLYDIMITDARGKKIRHISEDADVVRIETFSNDGNQFSSEFKRAGFDASDECGFVLTVDELLDTEYVLSESDFLLQEYENDVCLEISFDYLNQRIKYTVSLSFGVVTHVQCYEKGALVYEMQTTELGIS